MLTVDTRRKRRRSPGEHSKWAPRLEEKKKGRGIFLPAAKKKNESISRANCEPCRVRTLNIVCFSERTKRMKTRFDL